WTFYTVSDDASYLWIGPTAATGYSTGNALVKNGGLHPMNEASGTINLIQGAYYPIRIQFGENSSGDNITVSFTPPGGTRTYNGTGYFYVNIGSTSGGCGGGGMGWDGNTAGSRTYPGGAALNTATIGKGNYGGAGNNYHAAGQLAGGGGGGIGGIGPSASGVNPGRGGNGMVINIKGFEEVYGGGGGGGGWPGYTNIVPTPGGSATLSDGRVVTVGGTGQTVEGTAGGPGATNTGSGGGSAKGAAGGSGGSGIIIIRFEKNLLALQRLNNKLSFQINKIPIYEVPYVDNTWYYILWNIRNSTSTKGFIKINNNTRVYFVQLPLLSCISKNKLGTLINKGSLYLSNFVILTIPITTELESQLYNVTIDNVFIDNTIYTEYLRNLSALYFNSVKKLEAKSYGVNVLGSLFTTGNVVTYSDMRLKNVIGNIEDPLEKLDNINTFKYLPNDIGMQYCLENKVSVGVSAQDVQKVLPEIVTLAPFDTSNLDDGTIVSKSGNHYLSVSYEKLVPLLLECVKELKEEIDYINF
ncbi:GLEYA domain-containing protein, partial [Flavobacterium sp.]|uniref:GLEYA domain-containing protein n=1 Tax=Flavobacterium sp. TaxID=239 RepID=UPI0037BEFE58